MSTRIACLSGPPSGTSCFFNPLSGYFCSSTCSSTLRISTSSSTPTGTYTINIAANDGAKNSTQFTLTILQLFHLTGDVTGDSKVNMFDLVRVAAVFGKIVGQGVNPDTDQNLDGKVNISDLVLVAANLGKTCP